MKKIAFVIVVVLSILSCGKKPSNVETPKSDSTEVKTTPSTYPTDSLKGEYIGSFGNGTIIISINYINGDIASGYNIHKGNRRNIKGTLKPNRNYFDFELEEPGGDEYDGKFVFSIDTNTRILKGSWSPFDSTKVKTVNYTLNRRVVDHTKKETFDGIWYLNNLEVNLKTDHSGVAKGTVFNEKTNSDEEVEIPLSWFEDKKGVRIEWGKNNIFLSSKMTFVYSTNDYEQILKSGDYEMYRY